MVQLIIIFIRILLDPLTEPTLESLLVEHGDNIFEKEYETYKLRLANRKERLQLLDKYYATIVIDSASPHDHMNKL